MFRTDEGSNKNVFHNRRVYLAYPPTSSMPNLIRGVCNKLIGILDGLCCSLVNNVDNNNRIFKHIIAPICTFSNIKNN